MAETMRRMLAAALMGLALHAGTPSAAGEKKHDHEALKRAVERGEIQPLAKILEIVRDRLPGAVTRIEAELKKDRWTYVFRVVDANGRLFEVYVDAATGEIIRSKEK